MNTAPAVRIAMWSGPRNISTAMMRAWENRPDTMVWDEPFYGHYLLATGIDHPGRHAVIAAEETNWRTVVKRLLAPLPAGITIFYQKHMAHHLLPGMDRGWLDKVFNAFLIRDPVEVLASYTERRPDVTLADLGFEQQMEIFDQVRARTGTVPPVLDSRDVLTDPRRLLGLLCEAAGVPFLDCMLAWPPGPRRSDGVWARHWYDKVEKSTGFAPYRPRRKVLPEVLKPLADAARPYYDHLYGFRLGASGA